MRQISSQDWNVLQLEPRCLGSFNKGWCQRVLIQNKLSVVARFIGFDEILKTYTNQITARLVQKALTLCLYEGKFPIETWVELGLNLETISLFCDINPTSFYVRHYNVVPNGGWRVHEDRRGLALGTYSTEEQANHVAVTLTLISASESE